MEGCKRRKPILLILTISCRIGYVIGSLIGGKLSDYIGINETFLLFAAAVILYSVFLITLLRETNHSKLLLIEMDSAKEEEQGENMHNDRHSMPMRSNKVHMVDSD